MIMIYGKKQMIYGDFNRFMLITCINTERGGF